MAKSALQSYPEARNTPTFFVTFRFKVGWIGWMNGLRFDEDKEKREEN